MGTAGIIQEKKEIDPWTLRDSYLILHTEHSRGGCWRLNVLLITSQRDPVEVWSFLPLDGDSTPEAVHPARDRSVKGRHPSGSTS